MATKKVKSAIPPYVFGITALLCGFFLPLYSILDYLILFVISAAAYLIASMIFPAKLVEAKAEFAKTAEKGANAVLDAGARFINDMAGCAKNITSNVFRTQLEEIISDSRKIFGFIAKNPDSYKLVRSFTEYYLPQTQKLVKAYIELRASGAESESVRGTISKIEAALPDIAAAFQAQLDNLYNDKAFDIRTDIKVLENILSADGIGGAK